MFEPEMVAFLQSGCSTIIGTVDGDGVPHAGRTWGLDVLAPDAEGSEPGVPLVRLLIDADDVLTLQHLDDGGAVAITAANVPTLRSVQLKGRSLGVDAAGESDVERAARYCDDFFTDVEQTDGTERALLVRLVPERFAVCHMRIDEVYDQTPGPGAGAPLEVDPT